MPSASVKPIDNTLSLENMDPLNKVSQFMEKKIRNLEKRKNKLEHYKEELNQGKTLNEDQQHAIGLYDSVLASLDLCRELTTQISEIMTECTDLQKAQLKKQQEEKAHHEYERIKQVLKVQDILSRLGQENVRADFVSGNNGALQLSEEKLSHLDELYKLITPCAEDVIKPTSPGFKARINLCAENVLTLLDGKNKPAGKTTYREMKNLIYQIANCPYPKSSSCKSKDSSHSSTPTLDEPQNNRKKSKKKKNPSGEEFTFQESTERTPTCSPTEPAEQSQNECSSISSNTANGLPTMDKCINPESSALKDSLPQSVIPTVVQGIASGSELRTPLTHISPPISSSQILPNQAYFNQSPAKSQQLSDMSMDINDLVTSSRFNFLQESQVGQVSEQSCVYIDPAVVSFGSIKPESLIQLHEQQLRQPASSPQSSHNGLTQPQTLCQGIGSNPSVETPATSLASDFISKNIPSLGSTDYSQSVPPYSQGSTMPLTHSEDSRARHNSPTRQSGRMPEPSSWRDKMSSLPPSNQNNIEEGWGDPVNGDTNNGDSSWIEDAEEKNTFGSDFISDSDRRNNFKISNKGPGSTRGGGPQRGGYRGRGSGFNYQGTPRGSNHSYMNNFRGNRSGQSGSGFRGRGGSNPSRGSGASNNRGYRGNASKASFQSSSNPRGQF